MKKYYFQFIITFIGICCAIQANATKRTVNNGVYVPTNPGQYATISAAISAASNGDTIIVAGSLIPYTENVTIDRQVTLIGAGFNPQYGPSTVINGYVTFGNNNNCSGSTIMGFQFQFLFIQTSTTYLWQNITFYRNYFLGYNNTCGTNASFSRYYGITGSQLTCGCCYSTPIFKNLTLKENVFASNVNVSFNDTNVILDNNIFLNNAGIYSNTGVATPQIIIDHNLFLAGSHTTSSTTSYTYALYTRNAIVTNNIFYNVVPIDTTSSGTNFTSNEFDNNITYCSTTIKSLPWGGNFGTGDINNTNPLFTSIFRSAVNIYLDFVNDNLRPQSGSPVINAGTDATNIGPTGGYYPIYDAVRPFITGEAPVPLIETITPTGATSVNPGSPFTIQVLAKDIH